MNLNPVIERFYLGILDYADLKIENDVITSKNPRLGDFTVDGKEIALPYFELMKDPKGKMFFHLLNENYASPENAVFNNYSNMLSFVINTRLAHMIITMITLASEIQMQKKITSTKLIDLVAALGEMDVSVVESFQKVLKAALAKNKYAPLFEIFLKKNGEIDGTPYAAIGKVNFKFFEELRKATDSTEKGYTLFDVKVRKKDVLALYSIMEAIFPNIDKKDYYIEGTDNKIFRYLNVLLKTSYLVTSRLNEIGELVTAINEPALAAEELISNHKWVDDLETLYGMAAEIRLIPSQVDINVEAKRIKADESKAAQAAIQQPVQPPSFNPTLVPQVQQPQVQQTIPQAQQPQQLTPEDIIRGNLQPQMNPMMGMMNPMMQPTMNPMMMGMQTTMPSWVQAELMKEQQQKLQQQFQQQPLQQPMMNPAMMAAMQQQQQQQMLQQQLMQQQMNPMMMGMQPQQQGLQLNPHFAGQVTAPWN